mmetsp:Transcript_58414/g.125527  ORF Transcript_58414/g.125527 Transcript_58414/m.125527 type:complete len:291 (+) Transcript_58414:530-1402(+)
MLRLENFLQRHKHSSGLHHAVLRRGHVVLQLLAAEGEVGTRDREQPVLMCHDLCRGVRKHWPDGQIVQLALRRDLADLVDEAGLHPVFMDEANALRTAFLSAACVGILITLPSHIIEIDDVRTKDFPIIAGILETNLAVRILCQILSSHRGASELSHPERAPIDKVAHCAPAAMDQIHIRGGHPTMDQHADVLLHDDRHCTGRLERRFVTHHQSTAQLQARDFNRKIERRHQCHRTVRPSIPLRLLASMITRHVHATGIEPRVVAAPVLEEVGGNLHFVPSLEVGLRHDP